MPKKKLGEVEQMNQDFSKATGLKIVPSPQTQTGNTQFAKDVYKNQQPIPTPAEK